MSPGNVASEGLFIFVQIATEGALTRGMSAGMMVQMVHRLQLLATAWMLTFHYLPIHN